MHKKTKAMMEEFDLYMRDELIEQTFKYGDKELFLKLTSQNWKDYLYVTSKNEQCLDKNFKIATPVRIENKTEFTSFKDGNNRIFYKKINPRIYDLKKENFNVTTPEDINSVLKEINSNDTFLEKMILVQEYLSAKEFLNKDVVRLFEFLKDNDDALFNCHFVERNYELNGFISFEKGIATITEAQEDIHSFKDVIEVIQFYSENDIDFFICLDNGIFIEAKEAATL